MKTIAWPFGWVPGFAVALLAYGLTATPLCAGIRIVRSEQRGGFITTRANPAAGFPTHEENRGEVRDQDDLSPLSFDFNSTGAVEGNSATASLRGGSEITLDSAAGTLRVSANATCNVSAHREPGPTGAVADTLAQLVILTFEVTDTSLQFNATGDASATLAQGPNTGSGIASQSFANILLQKLGSVEEPFAIRVTEGESKSDTRSGTLSPGFYRLFVDARALINVTNNDPLSGTASATERFEITIGPEPSRSIRWKNPVSGSFETEENWDPQNVPSGNDTAVFDLPGSYTVSLGANVSHGPLQIHGSGTNVTLDLGGNSHTLSGPLQAGGLPDDNVLLTVRGGGGIVSAALNGPASAAVTPGEDDVFSMPEVRIAAGSAIRYIDRILHVSQVATIEGTWSLDGEGTSIEATQLNVGIRSNSAKLNVLNAALLVTGKTTLGVEPEQGQSIPQSAGAVSLNSGALWQLNGDLNVGKAGFGEINIRGKSSMVATGLSILAEDVGSIGNVSVKDQGSTFQAETLVIGKMGNGNFTISDSARGVVTNLKIQAGGTTITGEASRLIISSSLVIGGGLLDSTLIVDEGGTLNGEGTTPQLSVGNAGIVLINDGTANFGPIRITSGGAFTLGASSVVDGLDGAIDQGAQLNVRGDSFFSVRSLRVDGTLDVATTAFVEIPLSFGSRRQGTVKISPGGVLSGMGTIIASEIVIVGTGNNQFTGALIQPGNSPGKLTLQGNFTQERGSRMLMEVAGVNAGQFDVLHVTGNSTLGGTLEVMFLDGYLPRTGDSFGFLEIDGTISGDFDEVVFPQLEPGFEIKTELVNGKFQLTALNDAVLLPVKGIFRGVLDGDPAGHGAGGFFTIRASARGTFSTRFVLGGRSFALRGQFDSSGNFSGSIARPGDSPLMITLQLPPDVTGVIAGTILDGVHTIPVSADRVSGFKPKKSPAPQAGKYTALLQSDSATSDAPKADGIGTVVVSTSGAIRFSGALPDGTRLSQGTALSKSGEWPLFVSLYKKQGSLFGALQFREKAGSDFDGIVRWSRPATPNDKSHTAGFFATLPTIGSRYIAPPARPAVLDFPNGATATLNDAEATPPLTKQLALTPPKQFVVTNPGADQFSLGVTTANGLLFPHFVHPATGVLTKGQGVVFQKQNLGSGFFLRPGRIGSFDLQANP